LGKGQCNFVLLNLLADGLSPPQVTHVLEKPCHAERKIALNTALAKALFMLCSYTLYKLLEYLIGFYVLREILELGQAQVPRAIPIHLVEKLHQFPACQVYPIVCEHEVQLVNLYSARAIVVDVAKDALDLLIAQDLVLGLQVFLLNRWHWGISKSVCTALLEPFI
jgi:hypothetical protein